MSSVLDEVDDDYRFTMHKMNAIRNQSSANLGVGGSSSYYANATTTSNDTKFDAYRMVGRGTVNTDYASQALNRVLRPLGQPHPDDTVYSRYARY